MAILTNNFNAAILLLKRGANINNPYKVQNDYKGDFPKK